MHHAAAAPLHPAGAALLAREPHVDLGGGLGEREVVGPHARVGLRAEERPRERVQRAAQVGHGQSLVDGQPLDLMEHRGVGGVELVGPEGTAGTGDVDGRLTVEHRADLHRRGVCPQDLATALGRHVEGVLQGARGMIREEVERVEVVVLGLDLRPLGDLPAHRHEHVGDLLGDDRDGMLRPDRAAVGRDSQVEGLGDQDRRVTLGLELLEPRLVRLLYAPAGDVDGLARRRLPLLGQRAEHPAAERDRATVSQVCRLGGGQCLEVCGGRERRLRLRGVARQGLLVDLDLDRASVFAHLCCVLP